MNTDIIKSDENVTVNNEENQNKSADDYTLKEIAEMTDAQAQAIFDRFLV